MNTLTDDPTAAARQRRHYRRKKLGLIFAHCEVPSQWVGSLVAAGHLKPRDQRDFHEVGAALIEALESGWTPPSNFSLRCENKSASNRAMEPHHDS